MSDNEYPIVYILYISQIGNSWRYGFDTCQSPAIYKYTVDIAKESIEFCDAARFSMYIDSHCIAYPCSFGREQREYSVDLKNTLLMKHGTQISLLIFEKSKVNYVPPALLKAAEIVH